MSLKVPEAPPALAPFQKQKFGGGGSQPTAIVHLPTSKVPIAPPPEIMFRLRRSRWRFFRTENASRPWAGWVRREPIAWQRCGDFGGSTTGAYITSDAAELRFLSGLASSPASGVTELSQVEYERLTGQTPKDDESFFEDFKARPAQRAALPPVQKIKSDSAIIHCVERHKQRNADAHRRARAAVDSWLRVYSSGVVRPAHVWGTGRTSTQIGDMRRLPFLKDVLKIGMDLAGAKDFVMLTNDDALLHSKLPGALLEFMEGRDAAVSGRVNFVSGLVPDLVTKPQANKLKWKHDIGRDLFIFRKPWLEERWDELPDFLLGELEWDLVLSAMIQLSMGIRPTVESRLAFNPKSDLPMGYVFHEHHEKQWLLPENRESPAKQWNLSLMHEWCWANGLGDLITI